MDPHALAAMLGLFVITMTSPGPNTFLVLQSRLEGGARASDAVISGVCTGGMLWALGPPFGLLALCEHAPRAVTGLQLAGAAWFFAKGFQGVFRKRSSAVRQRRPGGFAGGLASSVLNPGTAMLFTVAMPAILAGFTPSPSHAVAIALLYGGLGALWFSSVSALAARGHGRVIDAKLASVLARVPGAALMGFGFLFAATA